MAPRKTKHVAEFGDFQTPDPLAAAVLSVVKSLGPVPAVIVEPSCGRGSFLAAAFAAFPEAKLFGLDINAEYLAHAQTRVGGQGRAMLTHGDFFTYDWSAFIADLSTPLMVLGNPPWVTNAQLGALGSANLPSKSNFQGMKGLDALTGKANFDISEWMLLQNLTWIIAKGGTLAVLCKVSVARKVLASAWKRDLPIASARMYAIDALKHFGAAVDACLFVVQVDGHKARPECQIYSGLCASHSQSVVGYVDNTMVSNATDYWRFRLLRGLSKTYIWRSGVKHDCAKVMELRRTEKGLINGHGNLVDIEDTYLYPLVKSSDIAGRRQLDRNLYTIVTQRGVGESTSQIASLAPRTWKYLRYHQVALDGRTSVIYRNRPQFSVFGVGKYTFAPWKIAISGLYKKLVFRLYGVRGERPTVFDDTVYFLPFDTYKEAKLVLELLNGANARSFLTSMIFWEDKRPITVELLKRLDINGLASASGRDLELTSCRPKDQDGALQQARLL